MSSSADACARTRHVIARLLPLSTLLVILVFLARTSADADLWGHLAFGRDIVGSGTVHQGDPYSFTSDRAWVNHEWLAESAMWMAYATGGAPGLVALKLVLVSIAGALLLSTWRRAGIGPPRRDVLLFLVALGAWPQLATMRPQVFSIALLAMLLFVLDRVRAGSRRWAWWLPPLFAAWVNTHGGWVVGAGVLVVTAAGEMLRSDVSARQRLEFLAACGCAALATLCNPYGVSMLAFLAETVRPERHDIVEWRSMAQLPPVALALWMVPAATAAVAATRAWRTARREGYRLTRHVPVSTLVIVIALEAGSFRVARLVSFFALAVGFYLVPAAWRQVRDAQTAPVVERVRRPWPARTFPALAAWTVLVALAVGLTGRHIHIDGPWFPEPEAAAFVKARGLAGRMLTWFDYGEYAIWHFAPAIRVSMDGRRETVYSDRVRAMNFDAYGGGRQGLEAVKTIDPDYVWLPRTSRVVPQLAARGWHTVFEGSRSTILSKDPLVPAVVAVPTTSIRSFPGP